MVKKIFLIGSEKYAEVKGCDWIITASLASTSTMKKIAALADSAYTLIVTKSLPFDPGQNCLNRMISVMDDCRAGMVYSDYFEKKEGKLQQHPVIECQDGSLRDDFNFGSLLLFNTQTLIEAINRMDNEFQYAALYDLRLKVTEKMRLVHVPEYLYTEIELDTRKSGEKMFDYVDPKNNAVQVEMEQACTLHLKAVKAWLEPRFKPMRFDDGIFVNAASVIIPVKNRAKTIGDAIKSVLSQKAGFAFNLIVVDNYSTDGTTEIIQSFSRNDRRVVHIIPDMKDLGIGGCWNEAVSNPQCGKFAIQLDSDDLYIDEKVVERVVNAFYEQNCAMVVGSYQMVNFNLEPVPPGLIDHKEWTLENGRNNALRINGLGAPRAFYTPVLRKINIPNVSYGEDYAVGLKISRHYQIGRIYEPLYLCRRWEENSDASLDIIKLNNHNFYKDKIRTIEFWARQEYIKNGQPV